MHWGASVKKYFGENLENKYITKLLKSNYIFKWIKGLAENDKYPGVNLLGTSEKHLPLELPEACSANDLFILRGQFDARV
ncbi:hypothetical protein TNCT_335261 [Trichonephila clavata]|uniref:Uncharacterized protein n=1 Tax=Trichonephila clavata TaxID=2740835 RepID=A0A8X6IWW0_TRICU|nr:hypothetical protein TNCT_335261 [Trichonephila clavata]